MQYLQKIQPQYKKMSFDKPEERQGINNLKIAKINYKDIRKEERISQKNLKKRIKFAPNTRYYKKQPEIIQIKFN